MNESQIEKSIIEFLSYSKWFVWKNLDQPLFANGSYRRLRPGQIKGISDLIAIKNGRVLFLEVKSRKGRLSESQKQFGEQIINAGGEFHVVRSISDVEEIIKYSSRNLLID